jgi:hypothetical protein
MKIVSGEPPIQTAPFVIVLEVAKSLLDLINDLHHVGNDPGFLST